jgi:tripartite-type tricarboxylate transporter receptor subunit TctC
VDVRRAPGESAAIDRFATRFLAVTALRVLAAAIALCAVSAHAQQYPVRPIRLVVGFAPGGGADAAARSVAQSLTESWSQPVVVDNRAGAGGNLAAEIVSRSVRDGYTLLVTSPGPVVVNPSLYKKLPYDPAKDLQPVTLLASGPNVLVVHPGAPANTVKELIELARTKPGALSYGSSGTGSMPHMSAELFKLAAKVDLLHVAYKGAAPAVIDLMAGRVDVMLVSAPSVLTQIRARRLKALAVTSLTRSSALPELPTLNESALPGYESIAWWGMMAPAGTPQPVVAKLNTAVARSLASDDMKQRLAAEGAQAVGNSARAFGEFLQRETRKWASVIKTSGLSID